MKCSKCQTEFEGAVCPNCGAQAAQPQQPQKQRKKSIDRDSRWALHAPQDTILALWDCKNC